MIRSIGVCLIAIGLAVLSVTMFTNLTTLQICIYAMEWIILCGLVLLSLAWLFPANDTVMRRLESEILELEDHQIIQTNDNHHPFVSPYLTLPCRSISDITASREAYKYRGYPHAVRLDT